LAFHLYPQVIPQFCNTGGFGPRRGLTPASPCPWVAHLVSGRILATHYQSPASDSLSLRLHGFSCCLRCRLTCSLRAIRGGRCQHTLAGSFYKRHAVRRQGIRRCTLRIPPTACQCRGSEALSSPSRGAFHLSLTVLVHYRWPGVSAPWRVVPPASHRVSRAPWYSGTCSRVPDQGVRYGTLTRSGGPSQTLRVPSSPTRRRHVAATTEHALQPQRPPACAGEPGLGADPVRSPLLRVSPLTHLPVCERDGQLPNHPVDSASSGY
jgi:hypothetical protein